MVVKAELISGTATVLLERGVREASSNLIRARHNRLTLTTGNPATRRAPHPTVGIQLIHRPLCIQATASLPKTRKYCYPNSGLYHRRFNTAPTCVIVFGQDNY